MTMVSMTLRSLRGFKYRRFTVFRDLSTGGVDRSVSSELESGRYSFVTTPIFYVNSKPHIGHLYTAVIADAYHRFQKMKYGNGPNAMLCTGTDEHGIKIEKAAKAKGFKDVITHCDAVSSEFRQMCDRFGLDYGDFIRTTEDRHKLAVSHFWKALMDRGHIYKSHYQGWYCVADEAFVPESLVTEKDDINKTKISTESGNPVEWSSEENYMFKLSTLMPDVLHWIKSGKPIIPQKFEDIAVGWIEEGFQDLSISRPRSRLSWGIPVPEDDTQVIYVWLDALINYLTVSGYPNGLKMWPPTLQVVGKDILKFHAIYWPAFLIAAGIMPPQQILCHSHWTVDQKKMSKSIGNVVDPFLMADKYGNDGLRYFLLREGTPHSDANFNEEKMRRFLNAELADTVGNLLNRCTSKTINPHQIWPSTESFHEGELSSHGKNLLQSVEALADKVELSYENLNFYRGLEHIMATIRLANLFVEEEKPWALVKQSPENPQLVTMLNLVFETLRATALMMQPIVPNLSAIILDRLNIHYGNRTWSSIKPFLWNSNHLCQRDLGSFKSVFYNRVK